jgi:hypothetical protein
LSSALKTKYRPTDNLPPNNNTFLKKKKKNQQQEETKLEFFALEQRFILTPPPPPHDLLIRLSVFTAITTCSPYNVHSPAVVIHFPNIGSWWRSSNDVIVTVTGSISLPTSAFQPRST